MTDTVYTARVASYQAFDTWVALPAGTVPSVLSDDNDTTYVEYQGSETVTTGVLELTMQDALLTDTDQFKYVSLWLNMILDPFNAADGDTLTLTAKLYNPDLDKRLPDQVVEVTFPGDGRYTLLPFAGWPDGSAFTQDELAGLIVRLTVNNDTSGNATPLGYLFVTEAGLDVVYNQAPTVAISADPSEPHPAQIRHDFAYTDAEGDLQERFQDRIYAQPAAGWPSGDADEQIAALDAAGETPIYEDERVTDVPQTGKAIMPPTGSYRRYVRAADEGSGQRYGLWDVEGFTMFTHGSLRSRLPVFAVTADAASARVSLSITTVTTDAYGAPPGPFGDEPDYFEIQRALLVDGLAATWEALPVGALDYDGEPTVAVDRFCPRESEVLYRVRSVVTGNGDNTSYGPDTHTSEWVQANAAVVLRSDGRSWLQPVDDDSLDLAMVHAGTRFDRVSTEDQTVYYAEGREDPVIFGGTVHLPTQTATFTFTSEAQWQQFEAIRALRSVMLLRTLYGEGPLLDYWVRFGAQVAEGLIGGYSITVKGQLRRVGVTMMSAPTPEG